MKWIVGLGNVGREYEQTRHNAGFMVVWQLGRRHNVRWEWDGFSRSFLSGHCRLGVLPVTLLLPQTMMNRSGDAVAAAQRRWPISLQDLLIVCDDVNLPLGRLRVRPQGSDGGQHGLASCLAALGTEEVPRLRIGIGCEPLPQDLTEYVLSPFGSSEQPVLRRMLAQAVEACEWWAAEGIDAAMNRVNSS
jgi:PTH1 family peptidyl-tRNA hydrolase